MRGCESNPDAVFELGGQPQLLPGAALDLVNEGVRDLTHSPDLHGFVIVAGSWGQNRRAMPTLWLWSGATNDPPVKLRSSVVLDDLNDNPSLK